MAARKKRAQRAPHLGLTPTRREKLICAFRASGVYARAAEAAGVAESTLRDWRAQHPDLDAELLVLGEEYDREIGQKARCALSEELDRFLAGDPVAEQVVVQKSGEVVTLAQPRHLNVAAVRTALTKLDRTWTHPPQEVEVSGKLTLDASISRAAEALADDA